MELGKISHYFAALTSLILAGCLSQPAGHSSQPSPLTIAQLIPSFNDNTRIENFSPRSAPQQLPKVGSNASGITWNPYLEQYFVVQNGAAVIYRYDKAFNYLGQMKKTGHIHNDTEGLTTINKNKLMLVSEANFAYQIDISSAIAHGAYQPEISFRLANRPVRKNKGFEAIAYRDASATRRARIYAGQEGSRRYPDAIMRVVYFELNFTDSLFTFDKSFDDGSLEVIEPFNAEEKFAGIIGDIAGMTFDPSGRYLIIVSQESHKAIQVNPENGDIISQLSLVGAPAYEGVTIGPDGELVFVSEKNWYHIFEQTKQP